MSRLSRLLRPASIAVVGGGAWCDTVVTQCRKMGFKGPIWPVHPSRAEVAGEPAVASVDDLPGVPDAAFLGVNRVATIDVTAALARLGTGGVISFASGFLEAEAETADGAEMQSALLAAAGEMPLLGPNGYGFVNALDRLSIWPDLHGLVPVETGVAMIFQSSNIALNLSMQQRGLPIGFLATVGNQAQIDLSELGRAFIADPRVTALGLHIEGIADLRGFEALARQARALGKPIVALKAGRTLLSQQATISHTASLAGSHAGAEALFRRLGVGQVDSLSEFLETLKLLHVTGPLPSNRVVAMGCSGGEASLMADAAMGRDVDYPPLSEAQQSGLREALGPKVALANPLDYHTYIWGKRDALADCFAAAMRGDQALGCVVLDMPRTDRCKSTEWDMVADAIVQAADRSGCPIATIASYPDTLPEAVAIRATERGLPALMGIPEALRAIEVAAWLGQESGEVEPLLAPAADGPSRTHSEAEAKAELSAFGLRVPGRRQATSPDEAAAASVEIGFPVVLKAEGIAHKTEAGGVALSLVSADEVRAAAEAMPASSWLVEEMVTGGIAELLIGVTNDPAHGYLLTLGAGGVLTELLEDTASLLLPVTPEDISAALDGLKIARVLGGYRGGAVADRDAITKAILALQAYVTENAGQVLEVEVNPLICTATSAVAADALIRVKETP